MNPHIPVVVIGAGPVGLAAAAHLLDRGLEPLVLEAGPQVGANIAQWRHVRLFSPWCLALDPVSVRLLDQAGWDSPDPDALPTGADLLERYLKPLAAVPDLAGRICLDTRVAAVARHDLDKVRSPGRERLPFLVRVRDRRGQLHDLQARAVVDASGTWTQPNPLGACGLPALGRDQPARPGRAPAAGASDRDRLGGPLGHSAAAGRQGQRRDRRAPRPRAAGHRPGRPGRRRPHRADQRVPDPRHRADREPGMADR